MSTAWCEGCGLSLSDTVSIVSTAWCEVCGLSLSDTVSIVSTAWCEVCGLSLSNFVKGNCSSIVESVFSSGENSLMQTETQIIKDLKIVGFHI